ncbi:MAG TPA: hypothetical protein DIW31_04140 [Bacteroidales bacterium]|nr:hypothetical protein [Bacteroidales bacterium]
MKKILVIDDNEIMRETLSDILQLENFHVIQAVNGKEGLSFIKKEHIDMLVTDIVMPEMDGIAVIIETRMLKPTLPILAISGENSALESVFEFLRLLGVNSISLKPFDIDDFVREVRCILESKKIF